MCNSESGPFLVDCGLFQGNRTTQELNYQPFPFDAAEARFLILTHAHIDHSGLLPKLVRAGFHGKILLHRANARICSVSCFAIRPSSRNRTPSESTRNENAVANHRSNRSTPSRMPNRPFRCCGRWSTRPGLNRADGVRVRLWNAGHLLGSASAEIELTDQRPNDQVAVLRRPGTRREGVSSRA